MMGKEKFLFQTLNQRKYFVKDDMKSTDKPLTSFMRTPCALVVVSGGQAVGSYDLYTVL